MNNLKVRTKMMILILLIVLTFGTVTFIMIQNMQKVNRESLTTLEESIRSNYDENIKEQVQSVISLLTNINTKVTNGEFTEDEGKKLAADLVRDMKYGTDGYFWIDTLDGTNVVLLGKDTEGKNRMESKDANGFQMVKAIIEAAQKPEGGFVDYVFPKAGETEASPKRSYSLEFEPFGWVVGTGNYTDYIDDAIAQKEKEQDAYLMNRILSLISIEFVLFVIVILICTFIIFGITKALEFTQKYIKHLSEGDFTHPLPDKFIKRKDDFGMLAASMDNMRMSIAALIDKVKSESLSIDEVVQNVSRNMADLNTEIEGVSATTEELAASMQETSASAEEINAMSQEMKSAAKSISDKSEEGSKQAVAIYQRAENVKAVTKEKKERIQTITGEIQTALEKALADAKVVSEIEALSESIMSITSQTNMLALNAAIEAARAGEAGRGFSVVAEEIRNLAEQSKENVEHIKRVTLDVVEAVNHLADDSERLLNFVGTDVTGCFEDFEDMAESYSKDSAYIDSLVTDFNNTSQQLMSSIDGVAEAINEVTRAANEGAEGTSDIAERSSSVMNKSSDVTVHVADVTDGVEKLAYEINKFIVS